MNLISTALAGGAVHNAPQSSAGLACFWSILSGWEENDLTAGTTTDTTALLWYFFASWRPFESPSSAASLASRVTLQFSNEDAFLKLVLQHLLVLIQLWINSLIHSYLPKSSLSTFLLLNIVIFISCHLLSNQTNKNTQSQECKYCQTRSLHELMTFYL